MFLFSAAFCPRGVRFGVYDSHAAGVNRTGIESGDRQRLLDAAVERLAATNGVQSVRASSWHETQPVGGPADQPPFLNGAAVVETSLSPELLLARLEQIEQELGRDRSVHWGPRTIDLDLLLFDEIVMHTPKLVLPHPRMALRRFVLEPAAEVAPSMLHPTFGWTKGNFTDHLRTVMPYVAPSVPCKATPRANSQQH